MAGPNNGSVAVKKTKKTKKSEDYALPEGFTPLSNWWELEDDTYNFRGKIKALGKSSTRTSRFKQSYKEYNITLGDEFGGQYTIKVLGKLTEKLRGQRGSMVNMFNVCVETREGRKQLCASATAYHSKIVCDKK